MEIKRQEFSFSRLCGNDVSLRKSFAFSPESPDVCLSELKGVGVLYTKIAFCLKCQKSCAFTALIFKPLSRF